MSLMSTVGETPSAPGGDGEKTVQDSLDGVDVGTGSKLPTIVKNLYAPRAPVGQYKTEIWDDQHRIRTVYGAMIDLYVLLSTVETFYLRACRDEVNFPGMGDEIFLGGSKPSTEEQLTEIAKHKEGRKWLKKLTVASPRFLTGEYKPIKVKDMMVEEEPAKLFYGSDGSASRLSKKILEGSDASPATFFARFTGIKKH